MPPSLRCLATVSGLVTDPKFLNLPNSAARSFMLYLCNPMCYRKSPAADRSHHPVAPTMQVLSSTGSNSPSTQEDMMEIAIAIGGLAAVFVGLGALILFTPYDK